MLRLLVALGFGFGICVEFGLWVGLTDYARFGADVATSSRFPSAQPWIRWGSQPSPWI